MEEFGVVVAAARPTPDGAQLWEFLWINTDDTADKRLQLRFHNRAGLKNIHPASGGVEMGLFRGFVSAIPISIVLWLLLALGFVLIFGVGV